MKHFSFLIAALLVLMSCSEKGQASKLIPLKSVLTLEVGEDYQLSFKLPDDNMKTYDMASNPLHLEFKSSDESVVTVSASGMVTGVRPGSAKISVNSPEIQPVPAIAVKVNTIVKSISLRLASYNVRFASSSDTGQRAWSTSRKPLVCSLVRQRDFDVCGFVEVTQPSIRDDLRELLGDKYTFVFCGRNDGSTSGEAVGFGFKTEKFTLVDSGFFYLNSHPNKKGEAKEWYDPVPDEAFGRSRVAAWGLLEEKESGIRLLFIASHFELNKGMRAGSAKLIVEKAKELAPAGVPVFFCGDLNAAPTETTCSGSLTEYFKDSYDEAVRLNLSREGDKTTYNAYNASVAKNQDSKRIDYMYYHGDNMDLNKYGVIYDTANGVLPSDHYPIYVEIQLNK